MMPAIELQNISKKFTVATHHPHRSQKVIKAVSDVSLTVEAGQWLGIIGPNGSGKTTVAKIMAGITSPTTGIVSRHGTIVPVFGSGAGFHGDLTGAENVILSGMLFGLSRKEILILSLPILQFAGLTEFADVPLKYYSSGMRSRLALSIATHVPADTLILDEVFAVGDAAFRQQSIARLCALHRQQTTIILVSHNTAQLKRLCTHVAYVNKGELVAVGDPASITEQYTRQLSAP